MMHIGTERFYKQVVYDAEQALSAQAEGTALAEKVTLPEVNGSTLTRKCCFADSYPCLRER
jgi:hypothetical protein